MATNSTNTTPAQGTASDIASIISLISSLNGTDKTNASQVADIADPFRQQRPQFQTQLNDFMANPGAAIQSDPSFQAAQAQGAETISRQAGAAGMANSGNRLADLFKFGQTGAYGFENQKFNQLALLSGATTGSPAAAAQAVQSGQQQQQSGLAGGLAGIINGLLGGGSGLLGRLANGATSLYNQLFGGSDGGAGLLSGNLGIDTGGQAGSLLDYNSGGANLSVGDQNIFNDTMNTGTIPTLDQLFNIDDPTIDFGGGIGSLFGP